MIYTYTSPASRQPSLRQSCLRKHRHSTEETARDIAKIMRKRYKKKFCVYLCRYCKDYHVGTDKTQKILKQKGPN